MQKLSIKYLLITVLLAFIFTQAIYYGSWPEDYESWTATKKMDYLWAQVNKDHSTGAFPTLLGQAHLALPEWMGGMSLWTPGERTSDQCEEGRPKIIHSVGMVGRVKIQWDQAVVKKHGLTGGFNDPNVELLARASSGSEPDEHATVPNIVFKHLRNGTLSGNLFAGHGLRAQDDVSFFKNTLASHVPNRWGSFSADGVQAVVFNWVFSKGPDVHGITGASEFAQYTSDGKMASKIVAPFVLIYHPTDEIRAKCKGVGLEGKNFGCFSTLPVGSHLYDVYMVMEPQTVAELKKSDVIKVGAVITTSKWTSTKFGDEQLNFKHNFWPDELNMRADKREAWSVKVTQPQGGFMDFEGPEKYVKFIEAKRRLNKKAPKY